MLILNFNLDFFDTKTVESNNNQQHGGLTHELNNKFENLYKNTFYELHDKSDRPDKPNSKYSHNQNYSSNVNRKSSQTSDLNTSETSGHAINNYNYDTYNKFKDSSSKLQNNNISNTNYTKTLLNKDSGNKTNNYTYSSTLNKKTVRSLLFIYKPFFYNKLSLLIHQSH